MRRAVATIGFALLLCWSRPAAGHARSVSYSSWTLRPDGARVTIKLSALDHNAAQTASRLLTGDRSLAGYLQRNLQLADQDGPCLPVAGSFAELSSSPGWLRFEWELRCSRGGDSVKIRSDLLFDAVAAHLHFARVTSDDQTVERVLTEGSRETELTIGRISRASPPEIIYRYIKIGIDHILSGWDHLVFLLTLILIARRIREVAIAVTGFTLGHSATLAMAVLGYATPVVGTVEALIGLSIALVAIENVWVSEGRNSWSLPLAAVMALLLGAGFAAGWGTISATAVLGLAIFAACYFGLLAGAQNPVKLRCGIAAVFGLVHGFGFAGALRELSLTARELAFPLLGFNIGVELGQLAVLTLVWPLLVIARRLGPRWELQTVQWGSAIAMALGLFWFVSRA